MAIQLLFFGTAVKNPDLVGAIVVVDERPGHVRVAVSKPQVSVDEAHALVTVDPVVHRGGVRLLQERRPRLGILTPPVPVVRVTEPARAVVRVQEDTYTKKLTIN